MHTLLQLWDCIYQKKRFSAWVTIILLFKRHEYNWILYNLHFFEYCLTYKKHKILTKTSMSYGLKVYWTKLIYCPLGYSFVTFARQISFIYTLVQLFFWSLPYVFSITCCTCTCSWLSNFIKFYNSKTDGIKKNWCGFFFFLIVFVFCSGLISFRAICKGKWKDRNCISCLYLNLLKYE